jgi:hypothetical protein
MTSTPSAEVIFGGMGRGDYPGAFPPKVEEIIRSCIGNSNSVVHFFSGSSRIGQVRIDLGHENATHRGDVFDLLKRKDPAIWHEWEWLVADPDYCEEQERRLARERGFMIGDRFADWRDERLIEELVERFVENVLWLDRRMPHFKGLEFKKIWLVWQGGWRNIRVLTWQSRMGQSRLL